MKSSVTLLLITLFVLSIYGCNKNNNGKENFSFFNRESTDPVDIAVKKATFFYCGDTIRFNLPQKALTKLEANVTPNSGAPNSFNISCERKEGNGLLLIQNGEDEETVFLEEIIMSFDKQKKANQIIAISSKLSTYTPVLSSFRNLFGESKRGNLGYEWYGDDTSITVGKVGNQATIILNKN